MLFWSLLGYLVASTVRLLSLTRFFSLSLSCLPLSADFRPAYKKLSYFKQSFPHVPVLALTATATPRVQHDTIVQLGLSSCLLFKSSFNRPNLRYEVRDKPAKGRLTAALVDLLKSKFTTGAGSRRALQCGIIYCLTKAECEELADSLDRGLRDALGPCRGRRVM